MLQFYFIRHAQSSNNALYDSTRSSSGRSEDPELSDLGARQAALLAEFLRTGDPRGGAYDPARPVGFGLTHLYCSLMIRAVATGAPVARALGLPLVASLDIFEEGGLYLENEPGVRSGLPGKDRAFFARAYPELVLPEDLPEPGWWNSQPYEPEAARPARARRFLAALLERHGGSDDHVAIFSHGGFYNHFLNAVFGEPVRPGVWFNLNNTAITRINFYDHMADLVYQNRTDFLPRELVT